MSRDSIHSGVIAWFAINPVAANLLMIMILLAGIVTAIGLRIEGFPSMEPTSVSIDMAYESGDIYQVEEGVAIKIEQALQGVPGVKRIQSTVFADGVSVQVDRTSGYDLDRLSADIKNQIDGISSFPNTAEQAVVSQAITEEQALWITAYGDADQEDLQRFSRRFEAALLALPSIQKVTLSGWRIPEIAIEVDERALQAHNLSLSDVATLVGAESRPTASGELRSATGNIYLKADSQRYYGSEFSNVVIKRFADGSELVLGDVAKVIDAYEEMPNTLSRYQHKPAINFQVIVDQDDNIVEIAEDAKQLVAAWQHSDQLPSNIQLDLWWDQSINMLERLSLILDNGLIGIVLVMLVLSIFLNMRVALWVAVGLPVCFAGGLLLMGPNVWDLTLNQLTTFGFVLVLGILVDDAVVVGESVYAARKELGDTTDATIVGVKRVAVPTIFGLLTTIAAFYPLSWVDGELGPTFSQFALVCTGCLLFSLIESKLILPAHLMQLNTSRSPSNHIFSRGFAKLQGKADGFLHWFKHVVYRPALTLALKARYAVICLFISVFILVVGLVPSGKVAFSFFPDIPEETITILFSTEQGLGYQIVHDQAARIEQVIDVLNQQWRQQYSLEDNIISRYYLLVDDDVSGKVSIELSPNRPLDTLTIANELNQNLTDMPGLKRLLVLVEDEDEGDFALNLSGGNTEQLTDTANQIETFLTRFEGVNNIDSNLVSGYPQYQLQLTAAGRALGLSIEDLSSQIRQGFYGEEVQRIQRGKDEIKVMVRYPAEQRQDITNLNHARVRLPNGQVVALATVATMELEQTVTEINRVDGQRTTTITADINEFVIDADEVMDAMEAELYPQIFAQYPNVRIVSDGDDVEEAESTASLAKIFAMSLLMIFILVAIPLKSYTQPFIIMTAIPFGIVGAVLGHWLSGIAINILSIMGILALSGVVVNDSLLLVNRFNELRRQGKALDDALVEAGSQRMRAILLTSLTTCLGLTSLLQETSEQAQFLIPAATSLAYGIMFATLITLILIPVLLMVKADIATLFKPKSVSTSIIT